jgi:hypothetical protein
MMCISSVSRWGRLGHPGQKCAAPFWEGYRQTRFFGVSLMHGQVLGDVALHCHGVRLIVPRGPNWKVV